MNKKCFHCEQDIPDGIYLPIKYNGKDYNTCCLGCQTVANIIIKSKLEKYYEQRTNVAKKAVLPDNQILEQIKLYDEPKLQSDFTTTKSNNNIKQAFLIINLITCSACIWLIEQHLINTYGIISAEINYTNYKAKISWDNNKIKLSEILLKIRQIGYEAYPYESQQYTKNQKKERKSSLLRLWVAGLSMMQVMMYAIPTYLYNNIDNKYLLILQLTGMILTLPVVLYSAVPFYKGCLRDLKNKTIGMDVPITISIILAFFSSIIALINNKNNAVFFDSISMLVFFLLGGRYIEQIARKKATDNTEKLTKLIPTFCHKIENYKKNYNNIKEYLVANLVPNDVILVKPGENFPVDGIIIQGNSEVNESIITGESLPIVKNINDKIIAGSTNIVNTLIIKVTNIGKDSKLGNIIKLIDFSLSKKPKIVKIANKYASVFLSCILIISILIFLFWLYKTNIVNAIWITISMLIITCPCAFSLATPIALTTASNNLASQGLLVKNSSVLEKLNKITDIIFDKTGTLTKGELTITKEIYLKKEKKQLLNIIYSLQKYSEHPIAKAFIKSKNKIQKVTNFKNIIGKGIEGIINNEKWYLGNLKFLEQISQENLSKYYDNNSTIVALGNHNGVYAIFCLEDQIKKQSFELVKKLKSLNLNLHLLSGDNYNIVKKVANNLKIDFFKSQLSPKQKLNYIKQLQNKKKYIMYIGDGVNDAPSLVQSDVSIAVDISADISKYNSDLIMIKNNMNLIYNSITLANKLIKIINQNFIWAILYNTIAIPIAASGMVTPAISALGMSISSLLVVFNSLRLLK